MKTELSNFEENQPRLLGSKREGSSKKEKHSQMLQGVRLRKGSCSWTPHVGMVLSECGNREAVGEANGECGIGAQNRRIDDVF